MVIQEMTEKQCRDMLGASTLARLACARNNQPYVVPIHIDIEGDFLYGYATLGQKIEWMRQNPLVCLEIDDLATTQEWRSVVVFGRYEELPHGYEDARRIAQRLFQRHAMWWEPASVPLAAHEPRERIVFRIRIDRMTGRRAVPAMKKATDEAKAPQSRLVRMLRRLVGNPRSSF